MKLIASTIVILVSAAVIVAPLAAALALRREDCRLRLFLFALFLVALFWIGLTGMHLVRQIMADAVAEETQAKLAREGA